MRSNKGIQRSVQTTESMLKMLRERQKNCIKDHKQNEHVTWVSICSVGICYEVYLYVCFF